MGKMKHNFDGVCEECRNANSEKGFFYGYFGMTFKEWFYEYFLTLH